MALNEFVVFQCSDLDKKIDLLDSWLMQPKIFANGAITGALDGQDAALYTYPEVAGYYLSYLASRLKQDEKNPQLKASAQQILKHQMQLWAQERPPLTRKYLQHSNSGADWRNQGLFVFDLAMLLRGAADVSEFLLDGITGGLDLHSYLNNFLIEEKISPVHWYISRPKEAPDRWSTSTGAYQLKVVAALVRSAQVQNDSGLLSRLENVLPEIIQEFNDQKFSVHNPHSIAYALEGALLLGHESEANFRVGAEIDFEVGQWWIKRLVQSIKNDVASSIELRRSDVIAQLLRLTCCEPYFEPVLASDLYILLDSLISADGSIQFALPPTEYLNKNTWPVLFARQALDFYRRVRQSGCPISAKEYICLY